MLQGSESLARAHDLVMLDLDGVVYVGGEGVPGAADHLARAREAGTRLAFVTNNASRPPDAVATRLTELGVPAGPADVVTSAQAAARLVAERHGVHARVAVLGGRGLRVAVAEAGLVEAGLDEDPDVVVTGYGPDVRWAELMEAAVSVRDGVPWVASNTDHTIPTPRGRAPGHGVLVDMLSRFTDVVPLVAGKPEPPLLHETIRRVGGVRPLMVGDRLDTDIQGAQAVEVPSLLVLTGVTGLAELATATVGLRPTHLAVDLAGLLEPHGTPVRGDDGTWELDGWRARVGERGLAVTGDGKVSDWWRVAACACWSHLDATGEAAETSGVRAP